MKTSLISAAILVFSAFFGEDMLTGKWESQPSVKGNVTRVVFKPDQSFEGFVNRKPFVTGTYSLEDSVFSFVDNGCDGTRGTYQVVFFSNGDSIRFKPIMDSCVGRKNGMSTLVLGRIR